MLVVDPQEQTVFADGVELSGFPALANLWALTIGRTATPGPRMIVFELICAEQHRFEGWFASGEAFELQRDAGMVSCPVCSTGDVTKLPAARIRRGVGERSAGPNPAPEGTASRTADPQQQMVAMLTNLVDHVLQTTEDVGKAFPEEARRIHRELAPRRGIRGTATPEESEDLRQEGIPVFSLPIPPRDDWQ